MKKQINLYSFVAKQTSLLTLSQILLISLLIVVFFIGQYGVLYSQYQQNIRAINLLQTQLTVQLNQNMSENTSTLDTPISRRLIDEKNRLTVELQQAEQIVQQLKQPTIVKLHKNNLSNILATAQEYSQIEQLIFNFDKQQLQLIGVGREPMAINELATKITQLFQQASIDALIIQPSTTKLDTQQASWSFSLRINLFTSTASQQAHL